MNRFSALDFRVLARFVGLTGGRAFGAAATFLSTLLIARIWGGETLGVFAIFVSAVSVATIFASLGFPSLGYLLTPNLEAKGDLALLKALIVTGRKHICFGSIFASMVTCIFLLMQGNLQLEGFTLTALCIAAAILAGSMLYLHSAVLAGHQWQIAALLPEAIVKPFFFLGFIAIAILMQLDVSAQSLMIGFSIGVILASIASLSLLARTKILSQISAPNPPIAKWRASAWPWMATTAASDLFIEFHILLCSLILAAPQIAILHVAFRFRVFAAFGMRSIYMLFVPKIIAAHAKAENQLVQTNIRTMNLLATIYALLVLCGFAILGNWLLGFFGTEFTQAVPLLLVISISILIRAIFGPASAILAMSDHHKTPAIVSGAGLAASLILSFLLFPIFGLMGIAIAYTFAHLAISVVLWQIAKHKTGLDCSLLALFAKVQNEPAA